MRFLLAMGVWSKPCGLWIVTYSNVAYNAPAAVLRSSFLFEALKIGCRVSRDSSFFDFEFELIFQTNVMFGGQKCGY